MVCTARYKHGRDHYLMWNDEDIAQVISRKNNGHVRVYIGPYKPSRFKTIPLLSFLKHFQKK